MYMFDFKLGRTGTQQIFSTVNISRRFELGFPLLGQSKGLTFSHHYRI